MKALGPLFFGITIIALFSGSVHATVLDRSVEVTTKQKNAHLARRELNEKAVTKAIEDLVIEMIGEEKAKKNRGLIESKILRMATRLIPFSKQGQLEPTPDGFKMTVVLKVNQDGLEKALVQNNLFFESDVQPLFLPIVAWHDQTDANRWSWWQPGPSALLARLNATFEDLARATFLKKSFFVQRPQILSAREGLAAPTSATLNLSEIQALAAARQTPFAITGEVQISDNPNRRGAFLVEMRFAVLQVARNRTLAQAARRLETEVGPKAVVVANRLKDALEQMTQDLAGQTLEAWQRGSTMSNPYRVTLLGAIPINVQEAFREGFKTKLREVKAIRERLITNQAVSFEIDALAGPKEMAPKAREIEVSGGKLVLKDVSDAELQYTFIAK